LAGEDWTGKTPTSFAPGPASAYLAAAQSGAAFSDDPPAYWGAVGSGGQDKSRPDQLNPRTYKVTPITKSVEEGTLEFYKWSEVELQAWGQRLYKAGMISNPGDYQAMARAWADAVKLSANYWAAGRPITPWEVIDIQEGLAHAGQRTPKTSRNMSKSLNIPSAEEADGITRQMFQDLLGRDPTDGEAARYRSILIGKAKQNPTVTTTIQNTDGTGNTSSSSTTTGGFSSAMAQEAVRGQATEDPEYGAYLAATTYMGALQQMLAAPV
jgi:hypothetical protein